jgi:hypothetical protein
MHMQFSLLKYCVFFLSDTSCNNKYFHENQKEIQTFMFVFFFLLSISQQIRSVHVCVYNLIEDTKKKRKRKGILIRDKGNVLK